MSCDVKKGQACHLCSLCEFSKSLLYFHPPCSDANLVYVARHCGQLKQTRERKPFTVRFCNSLVLTPFDYDFPEVTSKLETLLGKKKTSRSKLSLSNSLENHKSQRTTKYLTTNLTFFLSVLLFIVSFDNTCPFSYDRNDSYFKIKECSGSLTSILVAQFQNDTNFSSLLLCSQNLSSPLYLS